MVTFNPETRRRVAYDALAGVGSTAGLPKPEIKRPKVASAPKAPVAPAAPTTAIQPIDIPDPRQRLANILNVDPANLGRVTPGVVGRPVSETSTRWAQQEHIKANTPWYVNALTKGPVGGFLNAVQKPLAFTTSALKETIDVFTGDDASWGDFKKQYNDNYTFGRMLHDYDLLQDRDSGWQKFAAAAIGFAGDVALDPLSYLGMVGKGVGFGAKLATKGAGAAISREVTRQAVMRKLRTLGGDAMEGIGKKMKQGDWQSLADDLAQSATAGGKKGVLGDLEDLGTKGWAWTAKVDGAPSHRIVFTNDEIGEFQRLADITGRAQTRGATSVAGDDLRFAAKMMADSGLDRNFRFGADEFLDSTGRGIREQVVETGLDEAVETTIEKFYKAGGRTVADADAYRGRLKGGTAYQEFTPRRNIGWIDPEDVSKMRLSFGLKVPGTGPIGRRLGIAKKIDGLTQKVFSKGLEAPSGLRIMSSEAPVLGKLVTGIPQGVRNGIIAQAAKAAGAKKIPDALRRGGLFRLAGKKLPDGWNMGGKMADLKTAIRNSTDGVFIQQGKRVVHAMARGKNVGRRVKVQMTERASAYLEEVAAASSEFPEITQQKLYSALGGNDAAFQEIEAVAPGLVPDGRQMLEDLREIANKASGREGGFLGRAENYVPRVLSDDARAAVAAAMRRRGRGTRRFEDVASAKGPELRRKYVSKTEFDQKVADYKKQNPMVPHDEAEAFVRGGVDGESGVDHRFWGIDLEEPNTPTGMIDPVTGKEILTGSVEDQIADALIAADADYLLFADDLETALKGYVNQVSHRTGEIYTESMLFNEGVLTHRITEYVKLPDMAAVATARQIRRAREGLLNAQAELINVVRASADEGADLGRLQQQEAKWREIAQQKAEELDRLDVHQTDLLLQHADRETAWLKNQSELAEIDAKIRRANDQISETPRGAELIALERQRVELMDAAASLVKNGDSMSFAWETLTSGTIHLMKLERDIARIFGTPEAFEAFVGNDFLRHLRVEDIDASLQELEVNGNLPDFIGKILAGPGAGKWAYTTPEGKVIEMEQLFMNLNEVLQRMDDDGYGMWLGVEAELDPLSALGNEAAKVDFAHRRLGREIDEMSAYIGRYAELVPEQFPEGSIPTPEEVVKAEQYILDVTDTEEMLYGQGFLNVDELVEFDADLRSALKTYYAGKDAPVSRFVENGKDLDGVVTQIRRTLHQQISDVHDAMDVITQMADEAGQPVRIRFVTHKGEEMSIGVGDYVMLEKQYEHMKQITGANGSAASPLPNKGASIDDILSGTQTDGQLGSNLGGRYLFDGQEYYVKRYDDMTADGVEMPPGTGRDRITSEVLGNALYRELGFGAPDSYASRHSDGSLWHIAPWVGEITTVAESGIDPNIGVIITDANGIKRFGAENFIMSDLKQGETVETIAEALAKGAAADMLLANWDVVGMGYDNIALHPIQGLIRIDQGSTFFYRAMGGLKSELGWAPGAMSDIGTTGGMLDPGMNSWYAPLALAGLGDSPAGELANQVQRILDLRIEAGGMDAFVRRSMPTPLEAQQDLEPFIQFLDERLEALANRYGLEYIPSDDPEMMANALLAKRGFSQQQIDDFAEAGMTMNVYHSTYSHNSGGAADWRHTLNLTGSGGKAEGGWHDKHLLNLTNNGLFYHGSGVGGYNLLIDMPRGYDSIKFYGLGWDESEQAAVRAIADISAASSPDEIRAIVHAADQAGVLDMFDGKSFAAGQQYMDMFARVAEQDPKFFRQLVNLLEKHKPTGGFDADASRWGPQVIEPLRLAMDLEHLRVPDSLFLKTGDTAKDAILAQRIAGASFHDRLEFAVYLSQKKSVAASQGTNLDIENLTDEWVQFLWAKDPSMTGSTRVQDMGTQSMTGTAAFGDLLMEFINEPFQWSSGDAAKAQSWRAKHIDEGGILGTVGGWEAPKYVPGPVTPKGADLRFSRELRQWNLARFHNLYADSMSADGYSASVWWNTQDTPYLADGSNIGGDGVSGFANFQAVNPIAFHSSDVAMTHRNISRIIEEGDIRPEDMTELHRKRMESLSLDEAASEQQAFDALGAEMSLDEGAMFLDPADLKNPWPEVQDMLIQGSFDHPFFKPSYMKILDDTGYTSTLDTGALDIDTTGTLEDYVNSLLDSGQLNTEDIMAEVEEMYGLWEPDPYDIIDAELEQMATGFLAGGETGIPKGVAEKSAAAAKGEYRWLDSTAFFEWYQDISTNVPKKYLPEGLREPDSLEVLTARRARLLEEQDVLIDRSKELAERAKNLDVRRMNVDAERASAKMDADKVKGEMEDYLVSSAVVEQQAKMDAALETIARLGAPTEVPLENLPDDLIDLRLSLNALIENDSAMLEFALDEFERGAQGWTDLVSRLPEQTLGDLHKIPEAETILDNIFRSGMRKFGHLQGNSTLVDSMKATEQYVARGGAAGFMNKYDKLHNLLRAYMIAKPGFHGRNFMSGAFMNHLAGMNWGSYRKFMRAYWKWQEEEAVAAGFPKKAARMRKAMRGRMINPENVDPAHVEIIRELARTGSLGSGAGQVASEFVESTGRGLIAERLAPGFKTVKIGGQKVNLIDAANPFNTRNAALRLSKNFGMATETFLRGSLGFDTILKGGNASDAFDNIMKFHFDYDDLSDFERNVIKRVVPFYTWTRKNIPLMMEQFARRPEVFNRYMSLKKEIELMSQEEEGGIVPRWMQRQGGIRLPFKYEGENMMILPDLPFKAPLEMFDPALAFDKDLGFMERAEIALGTIGTQITPLIKAPYEWKAKQNLWKGYSYDGRAEAVPGAYTMIPGMMQLLSIAGVAKKNQNGDWTMPDHALHSMAQLLPTFTDYRRLFPDEEKYQQRSLSNWISWFSGIGLRTNTKWEQHMEMLSRSYDMREERNQLRALRGAQL